MTMILGLIEHDRGKLNALSLEMLTCARGLAEQMGLPLHALLIGAEARPLVEQLAGYGVATAHLALHDRLDEYAPEAWARCLAELIESHGPRVVLAAASDRGSEVLAHAAARMGLPLAAGCVEVQPGEPLVVTRQRWGGSLLEEARLHGPVALLTIAPHAVVAEPAPAAGEVGLVEWAPALAEKDLRARVARRVQTGGDRVSLADAAVVVGGGRGVGGAEGFAPLEELAALLDGAVGCSRAVTSAGWRPHADQIGQTGTRIAPQLYIACGISGATQHMVGCRGAKRILAINTDREAPMVAQADYAIVGDLREVVPALAAEIRKQSGG